MSLIERTESVKTRTSERLIVPAQAITSGINNGNPPTTSTSFLNVDAWDAACLIPLQHVQRVIPMAAPTQIPGGADSLLGALRIGQESILVYDLGLLLSRVPTSRYSAAFTIVIVGDGERKIGLVVKSAKNVVDSHDIDGFSDLPRDHLAMVDTLASVGTSQLLVINVSRLVSEVLD